MLIEPVALKSFAASVPPDMVSVPLPESVPADDKLPPDMVRVPFTVILPEADKLPPELIVKDPPLLIVTAVTPLEAAAVRLG